ncbi:GNAT family N-acetyltransferase [Rickettsiales bacterium]|nr:GNAT family N-acetyltransferase [Rickettsiales bacterium]
MKSIISKAGHFAKNVIYIKKFSTNSIKKLEKFNTVLLDYPNKVLVDFSVEKFHVKIIKSNDPLLKKAQKLRYESFLDGLRNKKIKNKLDSDDYDKFCDHLVVIDTSISLNHVVGTYRLLNYSSSNSGVDLYTETEFNLKNLKKEKPMILEVGRSCVDRNYRDGRIIRLLWRGLSEYIVKKNIDYIIGCASFKSIDVEELKEELSYLHHYHLAPRKIRSQPLKEKRVEWKIIPKKKIKKSELFKKLPPLIKAYLRVGSWIGEGAIIDKEFGTIDVCIILKKKNILSKYLNMSEKKS